MEGIYAVASSSSSVTYGNIASFIKEMLINNFPYNFFKYTNITSEIAYRNIRRQLGSNTSNEFYKRQKPWLIIRPQISVPSGDAYLYDTPLTKNYDNIEYGVDKRTLLPLIHDPDNSYKVLYKINRDQMSFDITLTVPSLTRQIDVYKYLVNNFVWERPYTVASSLEAMIPRDFVNFIGKITNVDIMPEKTGPAMIPIMIQQLNKFSRYPITYKVRNATSLDEFFMYYTTELLITLSDLSLDDVTKKNMVDESYNINFRINVEFNLPGMFFLAGTKPALSQVYVDIRSSGGDSIVDYIPIYTLNNLYEKYKPVVDNYRLYLSSIIQTSPDAITEDTLDISNFFEDAYTKVINETCKFNVSVDTLIKVIMVKDSVELIRDTDWNIDWNTKIVTIKNPDSTSTYRIIVYMNSILMNEKISEFTDDNNNDKSKL
jgi:hypothetical protein